MLQSCVVRSLDGPGKIVNKAYVVSKEVQFYALYIGWRKLDRLRGAGAGVT